MNSEDDMATPVTRRELRDELRAHPTREQLREELDRLRDEFRDEFRARPTREQLREELESLRDAQDNTLRQHVNAIMEHQRSLVGAIDDNYTGIPARTTALEEAVADLAPRVVVLERKVFAPRKRRSTKRRR